MRRVGIGLPVYNGERYLRAAVDSLLAQTYQDFDLVICDNASTDGTQEIAQELAKQDERLRYHRNETNLGAARNYNVAVQLCGGDFFKWSAHDDLHEPTFLQRCVDILDEHSDVVLAYPRTRIIDPEGQSLGTYDLKLPTDSDDPVERFESLLGIHRCFEIFGLIRRKPLLETRLMEPYAHGDGVLLAHLALRGRFIEIPEELFFARRHPEQSMERFKDDYSRYAVWFDPRNDGRRLCPYWRMYREFYRAVRMSPLKGSKRWACYRRVLRWANYRRDRLFGEVSTRARDSVRSLFGRRRPPLDTAESS